MQKIIIIIHNIINQPIDLDDMLFSTHNTYFTFTWYTPFVTWAINFSVYDHRDKLSIIPRKPIPQAQTQNLLTYFKEIFLVCYTQLESRPCSITYPDLSGADSVTKTFKRFFCSVALLRISNTTLDREWVRIVWEKKEKVKNISTFIWSWIQNFSIFVSIAFYCRFVTQKAVTEDNMVHWHLCQQESIIF